MHILEAHMLLSRDDQPCGNRDPVSGPLYTLARAHVKALIAFFKRTRGVFDRHEKHLLRGRRHEGYELTAHLLHMVFTAGHTGLQPSSSPPLGEPGSRRLHNGVRLEPRLIASSPPLSVAAGLLAATSVMCRLERGT